MKQDGLKKPFVLNHKGTPSACPDMQTFWSAVQQGNNAIHNQMVRDEVDFDEKEFNPDEIEFNDPKPFKAYVFCWVIDDKALHWSVSDPLGITKSAEFFREEVFYQTKSNPYFAKSISKFIGEVPQKETWEQMSQRMAAQVDFKQFTEFSGAESIPNLTSCLGALLRREELLNSVESDNAIRFEDCDDLITQAQKVFECCFKWMLDEWPVSNHQFIKRNWSRDNVRDALEAISGSFLNIQSLDNLATVKAGSIHFAAISDDHSTSLRPLMAATLFTLPEHDNHPLFFFSKEELNFSSILDIASDRNAVAHASEKQTTRDHALTCAHFTTQWITNLLRNIK